MGVLSITPRSTRLNNIGNIQSVNMNTGAAEASRAASNIGNAVVGLASSANNLGMALYEQEQKTRFNGFMQELQSRTNELMLGDGKDNKGLLNEDFNDTKEWVTKVGKDRAKILEEARKNHKISDSEWNERVSQMAFGFQEQWDNRVAMKAWDVSDKNSIAAAKARLKTCEDTLAVGDGTESMYMDWMKAVNEEIEKSHVTDPTVAAFKRREAGLRLVKTQYENKLAIATALTSSLEEAKDVRAIFTEQFKDIFKEDGSKDYSSIVKNELVKASLGKEGLAGEEKMFEAKFKKALKDAEQSAGVRRRYKQHDVIAESTNAQTAMILGEGEFGSGWDELTPADKASRYEDWLNSQSGITDDKGNMLTWRDCLKKYAPDRSARIASTINTYKKQEKTMGEKTGKAEAKATSQDFKYLLTQPIVYVTDDNGNVRTDAKGKPLTQELTPQKRMEMAHSLWTQGEMSESDMRSVVAANRKEFTSSMKSFSQEILADLGIKCPKAIKYTITEATGMGAFEFNPQKDVATDDVVAIRNHHNFTGDWTWYWDDAEHVYYSTCIEALNLTQDWLLANPDKNMKDAKEYYQNILQGKDADGKFAKMKMQEHFAHERSQIQKVESNYLRGRNLSLGVNPTTGEVKAIKPQQKKDGEKKNESR